MSGVCDGRVVAITGAGRGLGRCHALEFARQGAKVVVNDLGAEVNGTGSSIGPAGEVVDQIRAGGGEAVANGDDISDFEGAGRLIGSAVDAFGRLDVVVNNAGILRDRMVVSMSPAEWDAVIKVHLNGTFYMTHHAASHWRDLAKGGEDVDARIINTSSASGLYGNVGQSNYGAAKAGIAALTVISAMELGRYGITVNAIAPMALTRMTENLGGKWSEAKDKDPDAWNDTAPENVSPLVVWLGSPLSADITGRVFNVRGGFISVAEGWHSGPEIDKGSMWDPAELTDAVPELIKNAAQNANMLGVI